MMKVRPTRTDSAGNGYYTAENGDIYYGNAQNGYLVETDETRRNRVAKEGLNGRNNSNAADMSAPFGTSASFDAFEGLLGMAGSMAARKLAHVLNPVIGFIAKIFFAFLIIGGLLPYMAADYVDSCIKFAGTPILGILGISEFIVLLVIVGYNIYRSAKGRKRITTKLFVLETIVLAGIYFLNNYCNMDFICNSILKAVVLAFGFKFLSDRLDRIISMIRTRIVKTR